MATTPRSRLIRRIAYVLVALVVLGFIVTRFLQPKQVSQYLTAKVESGEVTQSVALTGTTEPQTRYALQFTKGGRLGKLLVKVGDFVKTGDVLATLENNDVQFQVESQKAVLRIAQANLAKALVKQRPEELKLNQLKVDIAKLDVDNSSVSRENLLDIAKKNVNSADIALQMAQTSLQQAQQQSNYTWETVQMSTWQQSPFSVYDSGYYYGDLRSALPQSAQTSGQAGMSTVSTPVSTLSTGSSAGSLAGGSYLSNQNSISTADFNVQKAQQAYDQAKQSYDKAVADFKRQSDDTDNIVNKTQLGLQSAQEQYKIAVATPRDVDVAPIKAQLDQAWAGVNLAEYQLDQTQLRAPTDGLVTAVALNVGEKVNVVQPLITLDTKLLYIKALVSEADITKIKVGQNVSLNFDAFGATKEFNGKIDEVDPSETIVQGVVYYIVKVQFDAGSEAVRPGMTANLTIQTNSQSNVLKIPARAVQYENNKAIVQVLKIVNNKQEVEKRNVEIGLQGDEDVQITSGLKADEEVVTFTKAS